MKTFDPARALRAAFIVAAFAGASTAALADIKDYRFELIGETVTAAPDQFITVRLVNTKTGKAVPDAVIFATRLDMAPDAMQEMATRSRRCRAPSPVLTNSRRHSVWPAAGSLSLGAKVQGEAGTVDNKLVLTAQK